MDRQEGDAAATVSEVPFDDSSRERARLPEGVEPGSVIERLLSEPHQFGFFQAVWLLESMLAGRPGPGEAASLKQERIRIRPDNGLVFPASDVKNVEWDGREARVTVTFMGLYGGDSPLPFYFYNDIATDTDAAQVQRDFLDIFNHRLYTYFYRAWKKYRAGLTVENLRQRTYAQAFLSLSGLGTPGISLPGIPTLQLTAFAGRMTSAARNVDGLRALLETFLEGVGVGIEENVMRWVPLTEQPALSRSAPIRARLGVNTVIGKRVRDCAGKFRIVLGPLKLIQYQELVPGGRLARRLKTLVRSYVPDYLDYDVELVLDADEVPAARLGDRNSRLGLNTWLGRPSSATVYEVLRYE